MKKLIISLILFCGLLTANNLDWVNEQVNAIKPPRSGVSNSTIKRIKDPFIFLKKNGSKKSEVTKSKKRYTSKKRSSSSSKKRYFSSSSFVLELVINKSALINGKWRKIGDYINNYKIIKIAKSTVTLKKKSKIKVISTASKNNLKFKK